MSLKIIRSLLVSLLFCSSLLIGAESSQLDIVRKARAFLGDSKKLDSVKSVHYLGTLTSGEGKKFALEIIFQKPCHQRITATGPDNIEITALDDYEAWQRIQDSKDPTHWNLSLHGSEQVKSLRANTFENLYFFGGPEGKATLEDLGTVMIDGKAARKVSFRYDKSIVFTRFFDSLSGRLVRTETAQGGSIVEEGEIIVDGIRFPKKVVTTSKTQDGNTRTVVVEFEKISINETFAASLFAIPSIINH